LKKLSFREFIEQDYLPWIAVGVTGGALLMKLVSWIIDKYNLEQREAMALRDDFEYLQAAVRQYGPESDAVLRHVDHIEKRWGEGGKSSAMIYIQHA